MPWRHSQTVGYSGSLIPHCSLSSRTFQPISMAPFLFASVCARLFVIVRTSEVVNTLRRRIQDLFFRPFAALTMVRPSFDSVSTETASSFEPLPAAPAWHASRNTNMRPLALSNASAISAQAIEVCLRLVINVRRAAKKNVRSRSK
jgi:hypothetical protein